MSGIYIHIPFCKQACTYCDFHFSTNLKLQDQLVEALCKEIICRKEELKEGPKTLYFGGGSPSVISSSNLDRIFQTLDNTFNLSQLTEVTLETNPDDHSVENLKLWKSLGINRLSIGIQSFIERDLKWMNRAHNADQAANCISKAREAGFEHLTIDLIYGIPNQTLLEWSENIDIAVESGVNHISAYCLTVEEKTALAYQVSKGVVEEKSHESVETEFHLLQDKLGEAGFIQYELSNFAKEGNKALHNANYWSGKPYLGLGPAAHSFDGNRTRRWNVSNNPIYIKALESNQTYWETEVLNETERQNETIMTSMRRNIGLDLSDMTHHEKEAVLTNYESLSGALKPMLRLTDTHLRINPRHWLMCDAIIRELLTE